MKIKLTVLALLVVGLTLGMSGSALATITFGASTPVGAAGDIPNASSEFAILAFSAQSLVDADDAINTFAFVEGGVASLSGALTAADVIADLNVYLDNAPVGTLGAEDSLLAGTYDTAALTYALDVDHDIATNATDNFIVGVSLTGAAPTGDDIAIDTDEANCVGTNNFTDTDDELGTAQTLVAIEYEALSQDFSGPPYSRPNGYLDAVVLNFVLGGTATPIAIDDTTVDDADFTVAAAAVNAFVATAHGDAADDSKIYLDFDEDTLTPITTVSTPALVYNGGTRILSADGEYGLPDDAGTNVTDGAPPAPISVTTIDDGDGKINQVRIQFSEDLTNGTDKNGISFPGLTIASSAAGAGTFAGNSLLTLTITQGASYNTGIKPDYSYDTSLNTLVDGAGNQVASFNYLNIPVADGAAPTLVAAKTLDSDDDGMFDTLKLDFSEAVELSAGTADDLEDNTGADGFNFDAAGGYDAAYNFAATGHTVSGSTINLKVIEVGSFDTAVQPIIQYAGTRVTDASGIALAADPDFSNVTSAAGVVSPTTVWMQDGISARVTSATWLDGKAQTGTTQNGKLDTIQLTFSEPMGLTTTTYSSLAIAGHSIIASVVEGATVYVRVDETGYDTGNKPDVTYSGTTIVDINNAKLMALNSASITELDGAYPVVYEAGTLDMGYSGTSTPSGVHNGQIDAIRLRFSENMVATAANRNDGTLAAAFTVAGHALEDTVIVNAANEYVIQIDELGASDTDALPAVGFTTVANLLEDANGLDFQTVALASVDKAPAAVLTVTTQDANVDGYLDGATITFSEAVVVADSAAARAGVTLTTVSNAITLTSATITAPASTQLKFVGTSAMGADKWDTGKLPKLAVAATNGINDLAAVPNTVAAVSNVSSVDGAAPVFGKAVGQVASKNIAVYFSEAVTNDAGADVDETDILYYSTRNNFHVVSVNDLGGDADAATWQAVTDTVMTYDDVTMDKIRLVAGSVKDAAANLAPADTIGVSDVVAPTLSSVTLLDGNKDGFLDTMKLVFSENINEENMLGWSADYDTMVARDAGLDSVFTLYDGTVWFGSFYRYTQVSADYEIIGINFTKDQGDADAAFNEMRLRSVLRADDAPPPNVTDVKGDNTINLFIRPKRAYVSESMIAGDTGKKLGIGIKGGAKGVGAGIGDFSPNYMADKSGTGGTDAAPPMIQSAEMVPGEEGYMMKVYFSEAVKLGTPDLTGGDFIWSVGSEEIDYAAAGYIVNITADPDTTYLYYVESLTPVRALVPSTLNYSGAGVLHDSNNNVANTLDGADVVVTPLPDGVGVEEADETDVPEVYALSKNFPNPFNPSTTINYDIAGDGGRVSMVIYNMAGQKVRTLVNEVKAPGFYSVVWDGMDDQGMSVASGIYLYKIISGDFSAIEKMTFVK